MDSTPVSTVQKAKNPDSDRPCQKVRTYGQQNLPRDRKGTLWLPRLRTEVRFESSVEEGALYCLDADLSVLSVVRAEPVYYYDFLGQAHIYVPDYRVERLDADGNPVSVIYECKPYDLLAGLLSNDRLAWETRQTALKAQGLPLIVITDRDLNGPRLEHARLFGGYVHSVPEPDLYRRLTGELASGALTLQKLKEQVGMRVPVSLQTPTWQQELSNTLYGLIARGELHADRASTPDGDCRVWLASMSGPTETVPLGRGIDDYLRMSHNGWQAETTLPAWSEDDQHHLAERQLLSTEKGQAWLKLFSLYNNPHLPLDADLINELHAQTGHSRQTLFRFRRQLLSCGAPGITFRSLVPALSHGGAGHRPTRTVEARVNQLILDRIHDLYLVAIGTESRYDTVAELHREICKSCEKENLNLPAHTTVQRVLDRLYEEDPATYVTRREGAEEASKLKGRLGGNIFNFYGELMAVDCTPCDVFTRKDEIEVAPVPREKKARETSRQRRDWTERATMITWVEAATSEVVLSNLIHGHPKASDILDGARRVMQRDQTLQEAMGVKERSPFIGIPAKVRMDSGSEFKNGDVERVLRCLGVTLVQRDRGTKHIGGLEERTIGTLVRAHHGLPGTTMHSTSARREYNAQKGAVLSFELLSRYHQLTVEQHNADHAPGRGLSRHDHALRLIEEGRIRQRQATPEQRRFLQDQMLPFESRLCQREGIEWSGLRYASFDPEFERLIQNRAKVDILHHPDDIRTIQLVHPKSGNLLELHTRPSDGMTFDNPLPLSVWKAFKQARKAQQTQIKSRKKTHRELLEAAMTAHKGASVPVPSRPDHQSPPNRQLPLPTPQLDGEQQIVASSIAFVPVNRSRG